MMSLLTHGSNTSTVEVTNITMHGVWLLTQTQELFMPYTDFPWFKDQIVTDILNVEEPSHGHFYWPSMDIDVTTEMIEHPQRFPLVSKAP